MTINELIKDLETIKARFCDSNDNEDDIEVFIPETKEYGDIRKTYFYKCRVLASSAIKDKIIAVVYKEGDKNFGYRSKG